MAHPAHPNRHPVKLPLALAIATLFAPTAWADTHTHLGTLTVSADRTAEQTGIITHQMTDKRTETGLRELLVEEPAIAFGGGTGTSQWISVRGMGQDHIDVKVDNAYSDSQLFHHQGRHMLDPSMVKIVSVQKGAGRASSGIGNTSGAIVAKTLDAQDLLKNSPNPSYGAKVSAGYNTNQGHHYGASAYGKTAITDGLSLDGLVSGNVVKEGDYKGGSGYRNLAGSNVVRDSALTSQSFLLKGGVSTDNHRLSVSHLNETTSGVRAAAEEFDLGNRRLTATELTDAHKAQGWVIGPSAGKGRDGKESFYLIDAQGNFVAQSEAAYSKMHKIKTDVEWNGQNLGFISSANANAYTLTQGRDFQGEGRAAGKTSIDTKGASLKLSSEMGNHLLNYGVDYRHQTVNPASMGENITRQNKTDVGVYAEAEANFGDITAIAGARYDTFKFTAMDGAVVSKGAVNPSLNVFYKPIPALTVNAGVNYATRSPRMVEALFGGGQRGATSISPNVRAEKARNIEVGATYQNGSVMAKGTYFWQTIDGVHGTVRNGNTNAIDNVGQINNQGYELSAGYYDKRLSLRASVGDSHPKMTGDLRDRTMYAVPVGRTWTVSAGYRFDNPNLEVGVRHRTVETVYGSPLVSTPTDSVKRDGYNVSDIYANWQPLNNDRLNVNFAVNNLFDKTYRPHSQRASDISLVGAGRDIRVGVNYTY